MRRLSLIAFAACLGLATVGHADPAPLVGSAAPNIRARPIENDREVTLEAYRGRVVLLAFVATWCGACRRMAPHLDRLQQEHQEEGLAVLALTHESRGRIRAHVSRQEPAIPWLQCTGRTAVRYGADGLPTLVLIDRRGQVRAAYQGATDDVLARLSRTLRALL